MNKWMLGVAMVATIGLLSGCSIGGSGVRTVKIEIANMAFSTKQITLKTGVPVKLVLVNKDRVVHDLSVDTIPITLGTEAAENDHNHDHEGGKQPDLHVSAKPGQEGAVVFTPTADGTYTFYCTVPGHMEHGMKGSLVVSADGSLPEAE